jgi:hypothetical protein
MTTEAPERETSKPAPGGGPGWALRQDMRRNVLALVAAVMVVVVSIALEMPAGMAVLLGLLIGARVIVEGNSRLEAIVTGLILVWALVLPTQLDEGGGLIEDLNIALAYVVMALGLNIVVGFAGLLDLGYVAFFAIGAYTIGWFGSSFFGNAGKGGEGVHIAVSGAAENLPGIHMNFLLIVIFAVCRRCACAVTTSPSSRSRSARSSAASPSTATRSRSGRSRCSAGRSRASSAKGRSSRPEDRGSHRWTRSTCRGSTRSNR